MSIQQYSTRLEKSHEVAMRLWWKSMEDLGWVSTTQLCAEIKAESMPQNRWPADLVTYLEASQTNAILLGDLGSATIGHILAAIYENQTGWIGLFVIQPQYRGRSYGKLLLDAAMDQFKTHATNVVGLDSVAERKLTYEKRGFVASRLGKIRCMSCTLSTRPSPATNSDHEINSSNLHLVDLEEVAHEILSQSDYDHTGFRRDPLWSKGIRRRADFFGLALFEKERPFAMESLHGWVAVRQASEGYRLGPIYARNGAASRTLIMAAMQITVVRASNLADQNVMSCSDISMAAEVWGGNPDAVPSFAELGWRCTGVDYHRMWLGGVTTSQQGENGLAQQGMFAIFDAVVG